MEKSSPKSAANTKNGIHSALCPSCKTEVVFKEGQCPACGVSLLKLNQRYLASAHAKGGMAEILLAYDTLRKDMCIIKTPRHQGPNPVDICREKLVMEAEILRQVDSPYVVRSRESFWEKDEFYLVIDRVEGETLQELFTGKPPEIQKVEKWFLQLLEAVEMLHSKNIVHRDITPANILYDEKNDRVVMIDFGTAHEKVMETIMGASMVFTGGYSAPEQFMSGFVHKQSDIFGLGATLYFLMTGKAPERASPFAPLPSLSGRGLDEKLAYMVARATEPELERRYRSVREIKYDLESLAKGKKDKTTLEKDISDFMERVEELDNEMLKKRFRNILGQAKLKLYAKNYEQAHVLIKKVDYELKRADPKWEELYGRIERLQQRIAEAEKLGISVKNIGDELTRITASTNILGIKLLEGSLEKITAGIESAFREKFPSLAGSLEESVDELETAEADMLLLKDLVMNAKEAFSKNELENAWHLLLNAVEERCSLLREVNARKRAESSETLEEMRQLYSRYLKFCPKKGEGG
ncbi:MAG: protein kinase, partial [Thermoplasmata archaeon]